MAEAAEGLEEGKEDSNLQELCGHHFSRVPLPEEMNGNVVFECYDEQIDSRRQFAKTMERLKQYAKKNLKYYEDTAPLFAVNMMTPKITKPVAPPKVKVGEVVKMDETDEAICKEELKDYVHRGRVLKGGERLLLVVGANQGSDSSI